LSKSKRISRKFHCIANEFDEFSSCSSSDALSVYEKESESGELTYDATCFSCMQSFRPEHVHNSSLASELGIDGGVVVERKQFTFAQKAEPLTPEQVGNAKKNVGFTDKHYRSLHPDWLKFFGHMVKRRNGVNKEIWYPETQEGKVVGFKIRFLPKSFNKIGRTGIGSQLAGQFRYKSAGKRILIVGGEGDMVAAWGMLNKWTHVVSPTCGESSAAQQCANNYDFLDQYEEIYVGMDNDEAGATAVENIIKVLPSEKIKIVKWSAKDPHKLLEDGRGDQIVKDFFNARSYVDSGLKSSNEVMADVQDVLTATKITLPPYMWRMERMMKRAFSKGRVVNIIGSTSCGKSTHVNNMIYHWIFSEGLKPLIISLEMTAGEYAVDLLSLHLKKNLDWFDDGMDAWNYLQRDDVKMLYDDLFMDSEYNERFRILDDRDGNIESLKKMIERGVKQYGCNMIIIDVLTDLVRFLPQDEQEKFMLWEKNFVKSGVNIVNVLHTRKPDRDKDGKLRRTTEYDALGTGSFVQSAHINIIINRDKMELNEVEKNSTYVDMPKCRRGTTGDAGVWYYDGATRQCYDREDFFNQSRSVNPNYVPPEQTVTIEQIDVPPFDPEIMENDLGVVGDVIEEDF